MKPKHPINDMIDYLLHIYNKENINACSFKIVSKSYLTLNYNCLNKKPAGNKHFFDVGLV